MPSVLFVCTANQFRSPLAAAIFQKALVKEGRQRRSPWDIGRVKDWTVDSAGTWAKEGEPVLRDVLEAGNQLGLDLSAHRSMLVNRLLLSQYDLVLVMQQDQREQLCHRFPEFQERIYLLSLVVDHGSYDFPDTHRFLKEVMKVGAALDELIRRNVYYICVLAIALHNKRNWEKLEDHAEVEYVAAHLLKTQHLFDPGMVE